MQFLLELLVAFFAAIGIASCIWLLLGRLLRPVRRSETVYAVVRAETPDELQRTVSWLSWLRQCGGTELRVLVLDDALNEEARGMAEKILRNEPGLLLGSRTDVENLLG